MHSKHIRLLHSGALVARANEEGAVDPPAGQFVEADANGQPVRRANAGAGQFPVERANANTIQAAAVAPVLTGYANGYPQDNVDQVVDFFAPGVPVPVIFQYRNPALANELGLDTKDQIGSTGIPQTVHFDPESLVPGQLMFRGLETPFTQQDRVLAGAMLGNTAERERQRRVRHLVGLIRRGRAYRVYAAVQAAAGSATAATIYADQDPFRALRSYFEAVILEAGSPEYVRVCLGYSAFNGFKDHAIANGAAAGLRRDLTLAEIAAHFGIPAANIMVSWHQVVATAQGRTAAKSVLIGADQMYIFACRPNPSEEDNSWIKTFRLEGDGGSFEVYSHEPHPLYEMLGVTYWDLVKETNAGSDAAKRLALTFSDDDAPSEA